MPTVTIMHTSLLLVAVLVGASDEEASVPYDAALAKWLIDPEGIVARNDVVYAASAGEPWEAMPVGGGDLSAMVRWDGSLHLHLSKSDAWGFQVLPDALLGARMFNNVSPGHVRIDLGERWRKTAGGFRQRLDLYRGRVVIELDGERGPRLEIWGHPQRKLLVVEIREPVADRAAVTVELSHWRPTVQVSTAAGTLQAREVLSRPARPHLANTGMQDFWPAGKDLLLGRGMAVTVACPTAVPKSCSADGLTGKLTLTEQRPAAYHLLIAAAVTPSGDPLAVAHQELDAATRAGLDTLRAEHRAWWQAYWGQSFLRLNSPDRKADWLCAAYHVHLYTLGCVNRGPYPAKWDGGPGLMRGDERNWGLAEWVQEIRFTYMPLYAANGLEMARGLTRHYSAMVPYLQEQTKQMWGLPGLWVPETVLPWGHAEDFVLRDDGRGAAGTHYQRRDPAQIPTGRFDLFNPYVGYLFTAGLEVCHHYLLYYRYSNDEEFLRQEAYPMLRGVCEFLTALLRREADGRYHLDPANALETWWLVRDPADTLAGIQAIFPEFIRLSKTYGQDADLRGRCEAILGALPELPRGLWAEDGRIDTTVDIYAPAAARSKTHPRTNAENPALYRVFPFGLSGLGTPDYDAARRTFERRICPLGHGWSLDALWAARLGLRAEACSLAARHAGQFNRYRYGGWTSNDSRVFPGGLSAAPFLDAGGLSAAAVQQILLQDHGSLIRVVPATAADWSGTFQLRAEGGFLVAADFRGAQPRFVEIRSLWGRPCIVANPWSGPWVVREKDETLARGSDPRIAFATRSGGVYLIEPQASPLSRLRPLPVKDAPNASPGLPGRGY
jgi:hypothetical protein